ncbi:MAG: tetratricopeptide repeat protein, partial [Candidatus Promineifilaceae bacterium]|nr:tetratricopeptide repeat protein [Candidatus Promineifilaceae bacterium]
RLRGELAEAYADRGRLPEAIKAYQDAIVLYPENANLYNNLATLYEEVGQLAEAEANYQKAIALRPAFAAPHYNLGLLYKEQGHVERAYRHFERSRVCSNSRRKAAEARQELEALRQEYKELYPERESVTWSDESPTQELRNAVRNEGLLLLAWGIFNVLVSGFSAPFGVLLIVVGLLSLYFRVASMLPIHSVIWTYAAITNLTVGGIVAFVFASIQAPLAVYDLVRFRRIRRRDAALRNDVEEQSGEGILDAKRAATIFPWSGCLLAGVSFASLALLVVVGAFVEMPASFGIAVASPVFVAILALGLTFSSLLSDYPRKVVAALGLLAAAATIGMFILLVFIAP